MYGLSSSGYGVYGIGGIGVHGEGGALAGEFIGLAKITALASGGDTPLCWNSGTNVVSLCSSSLRYKQDVTTFTSGLKLTRRLRPVTFRWKMGGSVTWG